MNKRWGTSAYSSAGRVADRVKEGVIGQSLFRARRSISATDPIGCGRDFGRLPSALRVRKNVPGSQIVLSVADLAAARHGSDRLYSRRSMIVPVALSLENRNNQAALNVLPL